MHVVFPDLGLRTILTGNTGYGQTAVLDSWSRTVTLPCCQCTTPIPKTSSVRTPCAMWWCLSLVVFTLTLTWRVFVRLTPWPSGTHASWVRSHTPTPSSTPTQRLWWLMPSLHVARDTLSWELWLMLCQTLLICGCTLTARDPIFLHTCTRNMYENILSTHLTMRMEHISPQQSISFQTWTQISLVIFTSAVRITTHWERCSGERVRVWRELGRRQRGER